MSRPEGILTAWVLGMMVSCTAAWADGESPFSGVVEEVLAEPSQPDGLVQVRVRLADAGTAVVRLAPSWYLEQLWLSPEPGDAVEIAGTRDSATGPIVASRLAIGEELIYLRELDGRPLWRELTTAQLSW